MGTNTEAKKRGMQHYLHKQWIATVRGKEEHEKQVKEEKEKRDGKSKG